MGKPWRQQGDWQSPGVEDNRIGEKLVMYGVSFGDDKNVLE